MRCLLPRPPSGFREKALKQKRERTRKRRKWKKKEGRVREVRILAPRGIYRMTLVKLLLYIQVTAVKNYAVSNGYYYRQSQLH